MFSLGANSIGFEVTKRVFGKQDTGVSPKGANDQTSFITALSLLGHPKIFRCFEIFYAKEIIFSEDVIFTLTGGHYQQMLLNEKNVDHASVYQAKRGDVLRLHQRVKGFRTYLMASKADTRRVAKRSKPYAHYFPQNLSYIRVTKGPEYDYLQEDFFQHAYKINSQSDMSGLRLEKKLQAHRYDIITSTVTDGTIQLTKTGPIVLMRHRQTTGGYPRIFNVIEADMDRLSQYPYGTLVRFKLISMEESARLLLDYERVLQKIQEDLV